MQISKKMNPWPLQNFNVNADLLLESRTLTEMKTLIKVSETLEAFLEFTVLFVSTEICAGVSGRTWSSPQAECSSASSSGPVTVP